MYKSIMNRTSMKIKIKVEFVNMWDEKLAFLWPTGFFCKDNYSFGLCVSYLFWGVGIVLKKGDYESE